ncbi:hypothetical protein N0V84_000982 [Fusarium piperis]|uniref:aldehyde dehydrogenase (NAD(+)) n=1 Tax=Fusarium piperis TaxID=1435070 RepID=A0A9W9BTJ3_9HYPO|nr:hypothetical protein N0V84_000982 [Fusarium piperis]
MASSIKTISPSTNEVVCERPETSLAEAREISRRSGAAFQSFRTLPFAQRRAIVERGLAGIQGRKFELGRELAEHMGRPIAASHKEIETMQKRADYLLNTAEEALASLPGRPKEGFRREIKKIPVGPTLIVFAWNVTGNSVILKPSPQTPLIGEHLVDIFNKAGLPENVLQVIQSGDLQTLKELVKLPELSLISFTGSTAGGLAIREAVSGRTIPVNLELGGNDLAYSCCAVERIYVHENAHDAFVHELQEGLKKYKLGDPLEKDTMVGPVISRAAEKNIKSQIQEALDKGAVDATPQNDSFTSAPPSGNYVAPTLLINVTHDKKVMGEGTFGLVIPVSKVKDDEEATKDIARGEELIK